FVQARRCGYKAGCAGDAGSIAQEDHRAKARGIRGTGQADIVLLDIHVQKKLTSSLVATTNQTLMVRRRQRVRAKRGPMINSAPSRTMRPVCGLHPSRRAARSSG